MKYFFSLLLSLFICFGAMAAGSAQNNAPTNPFETKSKAKKRIKLEQRLIQIKEKIAPLDSTDKAETTKTENTSDKKKKKDPNRRRVDPVGIYALGASVIGLAFAFANIAPLMIGFAVIGLGLGIWSIFRIRQNTNLYGQILASSAIGLCLALLGATGNLGSILMWLINIFTAL